MTFPNVYLAKWLWNFLSKVFYLILATDEGIRYEKLQHVVEAEATKTSTLPWDKTDKNHNR